MVNILNRGKKSYKLESIWRDSVTLKQVDSMGDPYPFPEEGKKWSMQNEFAKSLKILQQSHDRRRAATDSSIRSTKYASVRFTKYDKTKDCMLNPSHKNITTGIYHRLDYKWEDGLLHYIMEHNIKPSDEFIDMVFKSLSRTGVSKIIKYNGQIYQRDDLSYIKITSNQISILDALMHHGSKKNYRTEKETDFRYSEHAGALDFDNRRLDRIIVSADTTRIDISDNEIYLPNDLRDLPDYEYIFHTHPPTPEPGGRAKNDHIVFDVPSIGDILHFIEQHNVGYVVGSLVITSEGLYNIRKNDFNGKKIVCDEDALYSEYTDVFNEIQTDAIDRFGEDIEPERFYLVVMPATEEYLDEMNLVINKHDIHIDFYPREQNAHGQWIINNVYLPVFVTEPRS